MTKVRKLEREIRQLDRAELLALRNWFRKYDAEEWDRQIEADVRAGKLDKLAEAALADHKAGRTRPL